MRIVFKRYKLHGDRTAAVVWLLSLLRLVLISGVSPATAPFPRATTRLPVLIYPGFGMVFYFFLSPSTPPSVPNPSCLPTPRTSLSTFPRGVLLCTHYTTAFPEVRPENVFSSNFTIYVQTHTHIHTCYYKYK